MKRWKATLVLSACLITIAVSASGAPASRMWGSFAYLYAKQGGSDEGGFALAFLGAMDSALMGAAFGTLYGPGVGSAVGFGVGL